MGFRGTTVLSGRLSDVGTPPTGAVGAAEGAKTSVSLLSVHPSTAVRCQLRTRLLWLSAHPRRPRVSNESFKMDESANNTTAILQEAKRYYSVFVPILSVVALAAFLVNGYVLLSGRWLRKPVSANLSLSLSLAAADAWASLLILSSLITNSYLPVVHGFDFHYCPLLTAEALRMGGLVTSVLHLLLLATNHYLGIVHSLLAKRYLTSKAVRVSIAVLWLVPPIPPLVFFSVQPGQAYRSKDCTELPFLEHFSFRAAFGLAFIVPILATALLYIAILFHLHKRDHDPMIGRSLAAKRQLRSNRKLLITMILVMGSFLLGWLPALSFYVLFCKSGCPFAPARGLVTLFVSASFYLLIIVKLFLNALIYASRLVELRYAMWRMRRAILPGNQSATVPKEFEAMFRSTNSTYNSCRMDSVLNSKRISRTTATAL